MRWALSYSLLRCVRLVGKPFFYLFMFLPCLGASAQVAERTGFPLHISKDGRLLMDRENRPFLIKEISAWGLIQSLSEPEEAAFMDSVRKKGFNTLMVSIISFDTRFAGGPPDWESIPPFNIRWDFSTYNPAYFQHVDRFLELAEKKGMLVLLVPCYLGYKGDGNQGWWDELLSPNNSPEKSRIYGRFLGDRYQYKKNLIWVAGGDNRGSGDLFSHMNNIILGIKESDQMHLWTGHFESAQGTNWSTGNALYAHYMDLDGLYDFTESSLGLDSPQYKTELERNGRGEMIFQLDQSYEHDIPHSSDNENPQWIRRKNYDGLLSGCTGTSFCPGEPGNPCYTFQNWKPLMNTLGMREAFYCFNLFESRPWQKLIPDPGNKTLVRGRGEFGSIDYLCTARSSDSGFLIAYLPSFRKITVDMSRISGKQARAWWYDPRSGEPILVGLVPTFGLHEFSPIRSGDWIFVLDDAASGFPPPGKRKRDP
jgi:hypothetical protein